MSEEKIDIAVGSRIQIHRQPSGWRVEVVHYRGGITGKLGPYSTFEEAVNYLKEAYEVD